MERLRTIAGAILLAAAASSAAFAPEPLARAPARAASKARIAACARLLPGA